MNYHLRSIIYLGLFIYSVKKTLHAAVSVPVSFKSIQKKIAENHNFEEINAIKRITITYCTFFYFFFYLAFGQDEKLNKWLYGDWDWSYLLSFLKGKKKWKWDNLCLDDASRKKWPILLHGLLTSYGVFFIYQKIISYFSYKHSHFSWELVYITAIIPTYFLEIISLHYLDRDGLYAREFSKPNEYAGKLSISNGNRNHFFGKNVNVEDFLVLPIILHICCSFPYIALLKLWIAMLEKRK